MERITGRNIPLYICHTAVVGAGAAGLNAADELKKAGVDVLLIAPDLSLGTSRNAGSDKQTFYKLSLAGEGPDSPKGLARGYIAGGAMHGDTAYALAAGSARAFYKLVELGVPFPQNELGEFVGYQTDHDTSLRATSVGPLTSRFMAEKLSESCRARGVRTLEGYMLGSVLKDEKGAFAGLLLCGRDGFAAVSARACVLATGGNASVYSRTVYPHGQTGATGAAIAAGARTNNLCYWQYGLASQKVLWNVSGSYQQVLPAYRDENGNALLKDGFADGSDRLDSIFRKGYQWPFDARKLAGSSRVDKAVLAACAEGHRVYLDFRTEETEDPLDKIGDEAKRYLTNCGALQQSPIERLEAMNSAAAAFYRDRGIDLAKEPLEIAVCAQHCNGGIAVDRWWRTSVPGLYAAGECAGAFGMYRPGGSALNETQVGSLRAAQHIAANLGAQAVLTAEKFGQTAGKALTQEMDDLGHISPETAAFVRSARERMDICAGAVRDIEGMCALREEVCKALEHRGEGEVCCAPEEAASARNDLYMMRDTLAAMLCQAELAGEAGHAFTARDLPEDAPPAADCAVETRDGIAETVPLRALPEGGGWFETVWKRYNEGKIFTEE